MSGKQMIRQGYYKGPNGELVRKPDRPKTLAQAKSAVRYVFEKNGRDERSRLKYLEMHGVEPRDLTQLSLEETRIVLAAMEKSRMILFFEQEN